MIRARATKSLKNVVNYNVMLELYTVLKCAYPLKVIRPSTKHFVLSIPRPKGKTKKENLSKLQTKASNKMEKDCQKASYEKERKESLQPRTRTRGAYKQF